MKTKYLFGMLVSGALLTACTADNLDTASVTREVNPSAPVFNISIADANDPTRATYEFEGHKLSWTEDDLMSLFHGANNNLTGAQNAVYFGEENPKTGAYDFHTAAMVQPGYAVMVYPADVTFKNATSNNNTLTGQPTIYVSADQDASTKDSTAYISEVLNLSIGGKTANTGEAGYQKDYTIVLKRAVGTLHMTLNKENVPQIPGVDPIDITSVELTSENASFATQGIVSNTSTTDYSGSDYSYWTGISKVTGSATGAANKIISKDLNEEQNMVSFTLLPTVSSATLSNSTVVVNTTYGVVTITDVDAIYKTGADENPFWVGNSLKEKNVTDGLKWLINEKLFVENGSYASFKNSWYGQYLNFGVKIDLTKAKQDGMHIKTEDQLKTAIKVFDYMKSHGGEKAITLYLDGDDDNCFTIEDEETWTLMVERMAAAKHNSGALTEGIDFIACTDATHKACNIVHLVSGAKETEVPSISFANPEDGTSAVIVELEGNWTYDGAKDGVESAKYDKKTFAGVKSLNIVDGTTLTATNKIVAEGNVAIENYGEIVVSGTVDAMMGITNWNKITIGVDDVLGVTDGKCLTNKAAQATGDHGVGVTGWDEGAVIDNHGWLAVKGNNESSAIYNYGVINSYEGARTLITKNMRDNSDVAKAFKGGTNAIGTINIFVAEKSEENNVVVTDKADDGFKGFIVLKLTMDNPGADEIGDVANFVEIGGECANLTAKKIPEQVKFIKITSSKEVKFNGEFNIDGLYLKPEKQGATVKANIPEGASVTVAKEFYLKGLLSVAGTLTKGEAVFNGYHGGDAQDENDYIYRAGGKIE